LSVDKSVGNKKNILTDGFTDRKGIKKLSASFRWYFPRKNTVCNSVGNYLKIFLKNPFYKTIK
jgi:hypothetical protein